MPDAGGVGDVDAWRYPRCRLTLTMHRPDPAPLAQRHTIACDDYAVLKSQTAGYVSQRRFSAPT